MTASALLMSALCACAAPTSDTDPTGEPTLDARVAPDRIRFELQQRTTQPFFGAVVIAPTKRTDTPDTVPLSILDEGVIAGFGWSTDAHGVLVDLAARPSTRGLTLYAQGVTSNFWQQRATDVLRVQFDGLELR